MAQRRKAGAVRAGHGVMCNMCGKNCGKGAPLKKHVESAHGIGYGDYKKCYYTGVKTILADSWDDSVFTSKGNTVLTHILVRRFVGNPGPRGATRSVRPQLI